VEPYAEECCGFLLGRETDRERAVTTFIPARNAAPTDRERQFIIEAPEYLQAEAAASRQGLQLLGVYHSHPDHPAVPSDRDRIAAQPYFSYVIVSLTRQKFNTVRSWRLTPADQFVEEFITKNY
jgi:proteasome lid subunit RPN8/RPN11